MGKNKGKGNWKGNGLGRKKFSCGHSAFTDMGRTDCPKCKKVRK